MSKDTAYKQPRDSKGRFISKEKLQKVKAEYERTKHLLPRLDRGNHA